MTYGQVAGEVCTWIGAVPLIVVLIVRCQRQLDMAYLWLALAFGVSWLADLVAHQINPAIVSLVFPVTQTAIVAAVFLSRPLAIGVAVAVAIAALVGLLPDSQSFRDVIASTVGAVILTTMAWRMWELPTMLRLSVLVYFGVGGLCWIVYALAPSWPSYIFYQTSRAIGIALFCCAPFVTRSGLRMVRRAAV